MWEQIRANKRKSVVLIILMAGLLFVLGYVGGEAVVPGAGGIGLVVALVIWFVMSLVSYYSGGSIMLAVSGARKIQRADHPRLFNVVEEMKIASGLPKIPDIYVIDDPAPNAFATGRDPEHAAVAVTSGLLKLCNRDELQGVIAHEMAHVHNRDVLLMIMVGVLMGTIVILADGLLRFFFRSGGGRRRSRTSSRGGGGQAQAVLVIVALVLAILAPVIAQLIYLAVSRKREYLADACAAQFTRYPEGLASALEKIAASTYSLRNASRATAPMYIINPMKKEGMAAVNLSSTHPPIDERVKILRSMAGGAGYTDYEAAYRKITGKAAVLPGSARQAAGPVPVREPSKEEEKKDPLERARETTDLLWKLNKYAFIACACGLTLKVPPGFKHSMLSCPHCGREHSISEARAFSDMAARK